MNIEHGYTDSFFGTLPWMFLNILDLIPDGGRLELTSYQDGYTELSEWCFPVDRNLGHVTMERTYVDNQGETRHCHRDLYVHGYKDGWMNQVTQWITERFNLESLGEDDMWLFHFERDGNTVTFYDQVVV